MASDLLNFIQVPLSHPAFPHISLISMILHRDFRLKSIIKSELLARKYTAAEKANFQKSQLVCGGVGGKSLFERVGN